MERSLHRLTAWGHAATETKAAWAGVVRCSLTTKVMIICVANGVSELLLGTSLFDLADIVDRLTPPDPP